MFQLQTINNIAVQYNIITNYDLNAKIYNSI